MTPLDLAAGEPSGRGLDHLEFGDGCIAQPVNLGKPRPWRCNHFAERAEPRDERLRQRFDVPAGQRAKKPTLQRGEPAARLAAAHTNARTQPRARAVIVGRRTRPPRPATTTFSPQAPPRRCTDPFLTSGRI